MNYRLYTTNNGEKRGDQFQINKKNGEDREEF